jgi:hypothetical protein
MSAKGLILLGGFGGLFLFAAFFITEFASATVSVFAFGAIFGKGYGIWEERSRLDAEKGGDG